MVAVGKQKRHVARCCVVLHDGLLMEVCVVRVTCTWRRVAETSSHVVVRRRVVRCSAVLNRGGAWWCVGGALVECSAGWPRNHGVPQQKVQTLERHDRQ